MSDALVRRGLAYAGRRTPGIWEYNARGKILAKAGTIKSADSTYEVASVTERYTDAMTVYDSAFIVEAVNHYELALIEIQSLREREQSTTNTTGDDDVRARLRAFISASLEAGTLIDPHDLFALAEMPLVETPAPTKTSCPDCHRFYHQALEMRAIEISGPVLICECMSNRPV